jgi:hypothetical protein
VIGNVVDLSRNSKKSPFYPPLRKGENFKEITISKTFFRQSQKTLTTPIGRGFSRPIKVISSSSPL